MLDNESTGESPIDVAAEAAVTPRPRRRAAKKVAPAAAVPTDEPASGPEAEPVSQQIEAGAEAAVEATVAKTVAKRVRKAADPAKKAAATGITAAAGTAGAAKATRAPRATKAAKAAAAIPAAAIDAEAPAQDAPEPPVAAPSAAAPAPEAAAPDEETSAGQTRTRRVGRRPAAPPAVAFIAPAVDPFALPTPPARAQAAPSTQGADTGTPTPDRLEPADGLADADADADADVGVDEADGDRPQRRRGRRGRGRGRGSDGGDVAGDAMGGSSAAIGAQSTGDDGDGGDTPHGSTRTTADAATTTSEADPGEGPDAADGGDVGSDGEDSTTTRRRRRRRRRTGGDAESEETAATDPPATVVRERKTRPPRGRDTDDEVQGVKGSVRLEAKRQRRRDGRDQSRRRPPIITEAEFLARREAVDRTMVVRQVADRTQVAVLEDGVLVEHYVTKASANAYAGNVYLGKIQNVLSSMEAAFVDIGKSRNAVLYAGEVNWDAAGIEGRARRIEDALKPGQAVLCQVTKDPVGQKGARLTSQISLPGRYLVYVPQGSMTGISRKLPDTERKRLKDILKKLVPDEAGVIIRTAAEGASEEELTTDVQRLQAQWAAIQAKAAKAAAPALLYGEPDLVIRVVRDIFNEDFTSLVVSGDEAWDLVEEYVEHVSPDLADRLTKHTSERDVFAELRIDEQLAKGLDRKVFLPSGGSLVIDRTEAMTVVDVNTGKFIGKGGNLEETVTRNNLEAAEEIVRQLRLRDIGGMIVVDFIDMILESNRDLVLRRLTECLGRDRTRHQVAEVTSLGLVQMTRKRVGQGLLEAFSEPCETCKGRGLIVHMEPVEHSTAAEQRHDSGEPLVRRRRAAGPPPGLEVVAAAVPRAPLAVPVAVDSPPDGDLTEPVVADQPAGGALPEPSAPEAPSVPLADPGPASDETDAGTTPLQPAGADEPVVVALPFGASSDVPVTPVADQVAAPPPVTRRRRAASRPAGPPVEAAESVPAGRT